MQVGQRLRAIRVSRGLSQVQLADLVNVDNSLLCKIENGATRGSIDTLQRIAQALGVTVNDLLEEQKAG